MPGGGRGSNLNVPDVKQQARLTGDGERYASVGGFEEDMAPVLEMLESATELPEQVALAKDIRERLAALARVLDGGDDGDGRAAIGEAVVRRLGGEGGAMMAAVGAKRGRGGGRGRRRGKGKRRRGGAVAGGM